MDIFYMNEALQQAKKALLKNETPIGCVIVRENEIIAASHNLRNTKKNPLYHAEITAINKAAQVVGDWRLSDCSLYVTIEPCPMCAGAIIQARIPFVIFGAKNKKAGCAGSVLNVLEEKNFNHQPKVTSGVLENECVSLMSSFFSQLRNAKRLQ